MGLDIVNLFFKISKSKRGENLGNLVFGNDLLETKSEAWSIN